MSNKVETVAFDLGGVLAYQDLSLLTDEELLLFKVYMNRNSIADKELVEYAKRKMPEIYLKIHKLSEEALTTLEMLRDSGVRSSIWTNNIGEIDNWLEQVGLYRLIRREDIINSFYIGSDKPSIEFYQKALFLLKNSPQEVLFLDDSLENIIGAKKCGIDGRLYKTSDSLEKIVETGIKKGR